MARRDADEDGDIDEDDNEEPRPKRKKSKAKSRRHEDDSRSYKSSPIRFVILGVLVLAMLVLGFFLVRKIMKERAAAAVVTANSVVV